MLSLPTRTDMDGDKIACTAFYGIDLPLPTWVTFKATTCSFIFMPNITEMGN